MKREITKSRPESRPRPRQRRDFFLGFMFEPRNRRELSNFAQTQSRSRREDFSSVRDPARSLSRPIHTPPQQPTPIKSQELCVQWRFWDLSCTCGHHMVTLVRGEVTPPPIPSPPPLCVWCTLSLCEVRDLKDGSFYSPVPLLRLQEEKEVMSVRYTATWYDVMQAQ